MFNKMIMDNYEKLFSVIRYLGSFFWDENTETIASCSIWRPEQCSVIKLLLVSLILAGEP